MQKTENPAGGRGSVLVLKGFVCVESLLYRAGLAVKLWTLRWLRTFTSEMGMACSRWTDRLTIALEEVGK
ncbi:hypothetical protein SAMN04488503_1460 [Humidesulfovibrio mexicanus]|uniref:Uncharacterized protein n=1 Tax=Humidesulfovibrio mexicanus TaxID=147047 RepID=A0A238ZEF4_9BACT|nr:hypothetical protein [Humidesulfovibrio mexicanus]SNR81519.1 hypothetical protein SAMN04488503_1460 [Humidesulfovibrio mexicanus]